MKDELQHNQAQLLDAIRGNAAEARAGESPVKAATDPQ